MSDRLFLDTTVIIERLMGTRARQEQIAQFLSGYRVITSAYVLGEFLRTVVKDAIVLYDIIRRTGYLDDIEVEIAQMVNKRSASRCMLLWASLHRAGHHSRERVLRAIQNYIEYILLREFHYLVEEVINATGCGLAHERPTLTGQVYYLRAQCTRPLKECRLTEFLAKRRTDLRTVAGELSEADDPALKRIASLSAALQINPNQGRGRNCTWYLGDLIIALSCPPDAGLVTTNVRHFAPLCNLLGRELRPLPTMKTTFTEEKQNVNL